MKKQINEFIKSLKYRYLIYRKERAWKKRRTREYFALTKQWAKLEAEKEVREKLLL